eukprot:3719041-Pyramimonas_sp.AAC.1
MRIARSTYKEPRIPSDSYHGAKSRPGHHHHDRREISTRLYQSGTVRPVWEASCPGDRRDSEVLGEPRRSASLASTRIKPCGWHVK